MTFSDRATLHVGGADAEHFLQNLVTCEIERLDGLSFGALLTPQGKVLFDFFVSRHGSGYRLETRAEAADALLQRLAFYRLRAAVTLERTDEAVGWSEGGMVDPRAAAMGGRVYGEGGDDPDGYHERRVRLGVPEAGHDYAYGDLFPHDVLMDQFEAPGAGVARKGCYVGQEVVSRVHHRGTARKRFMRVRADSSLPPTGTPVTVEDREVGALGTVRGTHGLALLRIDRVQAARAEADGVALTVERPVFASFGWPA